jgi:hypothetical protein
MLSPLLSISNNLSINSLAAVESNGKNETDFSNLVLYENESAYYYAEKHTDEKIVRIENAITIKNIQKISRITFLLYSLLDNFYDPGKTTKTLLQNSIMVLQEQHAPAVTVGYLLFHCIQKHVPVLHKNACNESEIIEQIKKNYRSDFGLETNKKLKKMFLSLNEDENFISRFPKEIARPVVFLHNEQLQPSNKVRQMIVSLMDESFLSRCQNGKLFSVDVLLEHYISNPFVKSSVVIIVASGIVSVAYEYRDQISKIFKDIPFLHHKKNIKKQKEIKLIDEQAKVETKTFIFLYDLLSKMKNGQALTKAEIFQLLRLISMGIWRTYLLALLIKTILYIGQEYNINTKALFIAKNFKEKVIAFLTEILRRKEFEEKVALQQEIITAEIVVAIVEKETVKKLTEVEIQENEKKVEKLVQKGIKFLQEKCEGMPILTGYAARVQDRMLQLPVTKHDRWGNIVQQFRKEKFCTRFSKSEYEFFLLVYKNAREQEKLLDKQIIPKK